MLLHTAAGQYTGSAACGKCHPKQYAEQSKSGHARALSIRDDGKWAFGAGDQAITFVSRIDDENYLEHGLSYYTRSNKFALTPGHTSPDGVKYRTFDPDAAILRCFQCHSTGPLRMEAGSTIVPSEMGVRCESCHGPGEGHAIINPKRMNHVAVNQLCGACHRKVSAEEYTNWSDPWNVRHQPVYLAQSRCFTQGKLSCFTCHEPHAAVSRSAKAYTQRCQSCHEGVRHKTAVSGDCTTCHMPAVKLDDNLQFANHWIGVYARGQVLRPAR